MNIPFEDQVGYDFLALEKKWRNHWIQNKSFCTANVDSDIFSAETPKCYILDMFPYPSGSGLHMGHPKGYIASDIYTRFKLMQGYTVLHPMGFDSFGLPAEQYAIENNVHPSQVTEQNIDAIREQLQFLGLAYDWDREIATSRDDYYRWTQWLFLQFYDSWYDPSAGETDPDSQIPNRGRARSIKDLIEQFASGERSLTPEDKVLAGGLESWLELNDSQHDAILNNYRLVYLKEVVVNWCPGLGTVLANEEVTADGRSERGDHPVYRRPLKQWMMRITAYADRLLEDLDAEDLADGNGGTFALDWPQPVKIMQRNWIGRSQGAEVDFEIVHPENGQQGLLLRAFTTRPDTLFGATFVVLAPEHPLVNASRNEYIVPDHWPDHTPSIWKGEETHYTIREAVQRYVDCVASEQTAPNSQHEKSGIYAGFSVKNPVNESLLPVFIADYVNMDYGSGAIMAVPAHDERDHQFAQKYGLEVLHVVQPIQPTSGPCFTGDGTAINSPEHGDNCYAISGLPTADAKLRICEMLEAQGRGRRGVQYKLRDWIFSRQRYWGEPFPLAELPDGRVVTLDPPVILPEMEDFRPQTCDDPQMPVAPPLSRAPDSWRRVEVTEGEAQRELNVMPQWAGSCWYYLRFIDPSNDQVFCAEEAHRHFMPVDLYIGGAEHAVLHLLYSRFWHKALYDLGLVSTPEPFKKLFNQGMITADAFTDSRGMYVDIREVEIRDGEGHHAVSGEKLKRLSGKMGKRYKNGLPPEEVGKDFGVDTLRLYEMYMGPLEASTPWSMEGIRGMQRFLQRVWRNFVAQDGKVNFHGEMGESQQRLLHRTILRVTQDIEGLRFNTAIAALIEFNNDLVKRGGISPEVARCFLLLLNPFAPHICEELWQRGAFGEGLIATQDWPEGSEHLAAADLITVPIQINGKMRDKIQVPANMLENELRQLVLCLEKVRQHVPHPSAIRRFVYVQNKIVNIVV